MIHNKKMYNCRYCKETFTDKETLYLHIRKSDCSDARYKKKKEQPSLDQDTITFGKYKDLSLSDMIRDRKYCSWLLKQEWFNEQYEYLYNRVKDHNPRVYFVRKPHYDFENSSLEDFLTNYEYFYLCPLEELKIELSEKEKICYSFYLSNIASLKQKIIDNIGSTANPCNIKAPTSWLKKFEETHSISRDSFKEFLNAYDLPNIPYIVEDIKKMGGVDYKGAKSFIIVKKKSLEQENYWEEILKKHYGEDIGKQYKFRNCFFDFIRIKTNTIYECKLGLKDFNEDQHNKYLYTLGSFFVIYLIDRDCIVDLKDSLIYTTDPDKYEHYFQTLTNGGKFHNLVKNFPIIEISDVDEYFNF